MTRPGRFWIPQKGILVVFRRYLREHRLCPYGLRVSISGGRLKRFGFSSLRRAAWSFSISSYGLRLLVHNRQPAPKRVRMQNAKHIPSQPPPARLRESRTVRLRCNNRVTATAQHPTLDQFSWIEGRWHGERGSRIAEQTWLEPKSGEMAGLFRVIEGEKTLVLELFSMLRSRKESSSTSAICP